MHQPHGRAGRDIAGLASHRFPDLAPPCPVRGAFPARASVPCRRRDDVVEDTPNEEQLDLPARWAPGA